MRIGFVALLMLTLVACKGADKTQSGAPAPSATPAATVVAVSDAGLAARASASAAAATMADGSKLLAVFPPTGLDGATSKVERPTKEGFAEVVYKKGADDVATITITDTTAVPAVRDDYKGAKENVAGSP